MEHYSEIESMFLHLLEEKSSGSVFQIWFKDLKIESLEQETITISTSSDFKMKVIKDHHLSFLSSVLDETLGFHVDIQLTVRQDQPPQENGEPSQKKTFTPPLQEKEIIARNIEGKDQVSGYTFDNFIVGDSNRFAHAACLAVAKSFTTDEEILTNPLEEKYNPLFIYGQSGIGKTHLLYAITNEIKKRTPNVKIIYIRGEDFLNAFIETVKEGNPSQFRDRFRTADVLLIDDIHIIAGKTAVQEEFFNTFNVLYENQKQIILTSDRPPREISNLSDRLVTRLEWGLMADIQPPSAELRSAIIRAKAKEQGIEFTPEIISFMSDNIKSNIRSIEGAIKKLYALHLLTNVPITLENVKKALSDVQSGSSENAFIIDRILNMVSKKTKIDVNTIKGKKRQEDIAYARHMSMYLMRNFSSYTLEEIGNIFDCKHSTVMLAINKIEELISSTPLVKEDFEFFKKELEN